MIPNQASTLILNNIIKAYNRSLNCIDIAQSIENYCVSFDDETKILKLNYGLSKIDSNLSILKNNCINFGKGIGKITDSSNYIEFPNQNDSQFGYEIYDIYEHTEDLQNCYILGAIYLSVNNSNIDINFVTAKYTNEANGNDVILSKDIPLTIVEEILKFENEIYFPSPTLVNTESILIYKYIIDIEKFINNRKLDRFFIFLYDQRLPEGLFGLSEEVLYNNLIIGIINGNQQLNALLDLELNNIKDVVQKWMDLDGWGDSFINYWILPDNNLPEELSDFINLEMGILI